MTARLYIVRHGNTFDRGDVVTRVGGRTDLPLSVSGRAQADALARHFAGISFATARSGPLKRTRETARAILAAQSAALELTTDLFLREIDYGPDENRPEADVLEHGGMLACGAEFVFLAHGGEDVLREPHRATVGRADAGGPGEWCGLLVFAQGVQRFPGELDDGRDDIAF